MKKTAILISLIVTLISLDTNANRSMYVDASQNIIGNIAAENELLSYAKSHKIEELLIYDFHKINARHNLSDTRTNGLLANFIYKAKTDYGILCIGAIGENAAFFTNIIDAYNNSRKNPLEKIDIYNLEFEFWNAELPDSVLASSYCKSYLIPNKHPCTIDGAFDFYLSVLDKMNSLAKNNTHPITIQSYVGRVTKEQAKKIGTNLDKLLISAYAKDPSSAFKYSEERIKKFANGNPNLEVSIIFSSEIKSEEGNEFMGNWLVNNRMIKAEKIFTKIWKKESSDWKNNINLVGFSYFNYSLNKNILLSSDKKGNPIEENSQSLKH